MLLKVLTKIVLQMYVCGSCRRSVSAWMPCMLEWVSGILEITGSHSTHSLLPSYQYFIHRKRSGTLREQIYTSLTIIWAENSQAPSALSVVIGRYNPMVRR